VCVGCWPVTLLEQFINLLAESENQRLKIINNPNQRNLKILAFNYLSLSAVAYYAGDNNNSEIILPRQMLMEVLVDLNNSAGIKYSGFADFGIITVAEKTKAVGGSSKPRDHINDISKWSSWEDVCQLYSLLATVPDIDAFQQEQLAAFRQLELEYNAEHTPNDAPAASDDSIEANSSDPESESSDGMVIDQ